MKEDTREMLKRMRGKPYIPETEKKDDETKKNLDMRDMLKITRNINEEEEILQNKKTIFDQSEEEDKMRAAFNDLNVVIDFQPLEIYNDYVFWGGTIDGMILFVYKVTKEEKTAGYKLEFKDDFKPDVADLEAPETPEDDDNTRVAKRIVKYYNSFYTFWRNEMLNK